MKSSSSSKLLLSQTSKITGVPGQIVGNVPVALSGGTLTIKLTERFVQAQVESFFGLETKEIWIPLEDVRAVEVGEGCT